MLRPNSQLLTCFETGQPILKLWSAYFENGQSLAMHSSVISVNPIYRVDNCAADLEVFLSQKFPLGKKWEHHHTYRYSIRNVV